MASPSPKFFNKSFFYTVLITTGSLNVMYFALAMLYPKLREMRDIAGLLVSPYPGMKWIMDIALTPVIVAQVMWLPVIIFLICWIISPCRRKYSGLLKGSSALYSLAVLALTGLILVSMVFHGWRIAEEQWFKSDFQRDALERFAVNEMVEGRYEAFQRRISKISNSEMKQVDDPSTLPIDIQEDKLRHLIPGLQTIPNLEGKKMLLSMICGFSDSVILDHYEAYDILLPQINLISGQEFAEIMPAITWARQTAEEENWPKAPVIVNVETDVTYYYY